MKKVLVSRYCAYGDAIFVSHLPRLLSDQGFDVIDFEVNNKALQVLYRNPYITNLRVFNPRMDMTFNDLEEHFKQISKGYDKFINLFGSLEHGCIAMESDKLYYESDEYRRKELGGINFYDQTTAWAGYPDLCGQYFPELYFSDEEEQLTKRWIDQYKGKFNVLINVNGTSRHKRFIQAQEVANRILGMYEDAHIILTGDKDEFAFSGDRITSIIGKKPFMQAVLLCKYVNCVICMESGLGVGADLYDTPSIFLLTSSSPTNTSKYAKNTTCIQSPAICSPCHKGPYEYIGCKLKDGNPICIYFDVDQIINEVKKAKEYASRHS